MKEWEEDFDIQAQLHQQLILLVGGKLGGRNYSIFTIIIMIQSTLVVGMSGGIQELFLFLTSGLGCMHLY